MTKKNEKLDEKFEASLDAPGELPDPVATGDNKRPADKTDGEKASKSLTKAQMISGITHAAYKQSHPELTAKYREFFKLADGGAVSAEANKATIKAGGLKEDMDAVFEGADLSEEAMDKVTTIFEAAVNSAIVQETARLEEEFEVRLEEEVGSIMETLSESLEKYLDHVAQQWLDENKLAVEQGIRTDITESFMAAMKGVFLEHHVEIPDEAVDVVEALTTQVQELTDKLNESQNEVIEAKKALDEATAASVLADVSEGLTDTQKDKLATLAESIDFSDADTYKTKLTQICEGLVAKKAAVSADDQLNEEVELDEDKKSGGAIDPMVAAALAHVGKNYGKK